MSNLLAPNPSPWQRALESVGDARRPLDADVIKRYRDPYAIPAEHLWALAHSMSVDFWLDSWPEAKKRNVIAGAIELARLKGTEEGLRRFVELVDARVVEILTAPVDFFAAANPTKEAWDAYFNRLPEFRLYVNGRVGEPDDGFYADLSFADHTFTVPDRGEFLYGRRGVLARDGVETELEISKLTTLVRNTTVVVAERVSQPGDAGAALIADHSFADACFLDTFITEARLFTLSLDRSYDHETSELGIDTIEPGLTPINPRFERDSQVLDAEGGFYADASFAGEAFATEDRAFRMMYDRLKLMDPAIVAPLGGYGAFADNSRISLGAFTAEVMIDIQQDRLKPELYADDGFADSFFACPDHLEQHELVRRAVVASKAKRDRIHITFDTERKATLYDGVNLNSGGVFNKRLPRKL